MNTHEADGKKVDALAGGLATIVVPRVLDASFAGAVRRAIDALTDRSRVVVFVSADRDTFCLGLDLESLVSGAAPTTTITTSLSDALIAIHECPRPTVAVVRGRAVGGGVGLLAACDYVLAEEDATFALPEMLYGFVPGAIWPLVTARIGPARARAWAVTAVARDARDAFSAGLVDEVASRETLDARTRAVARKVSRIDASALGLLRSWSSLSTTMATRDAIARGAALTAERLEREDVRERLRGFFLDGMAPWSREEGGQKG